MTTTTIDLTKVSAEDLQQLLKQKQKEEQNARTAKRDAYEGIRASVVHAIMKKVEQVTSDVENLHSFVNNETNSFKDVMAEYGQLRSTGQMSHTITEGNYKIEVKSNKVKRFDERADVAAERLIDFMRNWIVNAEGGTDNPMYQLAMVLLERNKDGDLDYKNISKLYELESKFNEDEYSEIMQLFKESHLVEGQATRYYFSKKDKQGVWRKIEPSFNRMY